ncbi:MAG TPA: YdcF family protein, partial [Candidatus Saccharimonadales bacterium]|nr:YdcF family protein [Candidatus Saccharimonadales bacterium]
VKQGAELYRKGLAPKFIFSGGSMQAETMKQFALTLNIPAKDIFLEDTSLNTYENLIQSKKIMRDHNFHSAIIVTDAFHEPRASLIASKLGIRHSVSPAIQSPCWTKGKYFSLFTLREPLAIMVYKIQKRL